MSLRTLPRFLQVCVGATKVVHFSSIGAWWLVKIGAGVAYVCVRQELEAVWRA